MQEKKQDQQSRKLAWPPNFAVVVVEDTKSMRLLLCHILGRMGIKNIHSFSDGASALQHLKSADAALVLSDWHMPYLSGLDLVRALRADEELKTIPVLLMNGSAEQEEVLEAARVGVNGYIVKPFSALLIEEKIQSLFPSVR